MQTNYLEISYECLSAIGNSFEIESMMSEVVITFYGETKATYSGYYKEDDSKSAMVSFGLNQEVEFVIEGKKCNLIEMKENFFIILPLKKGYIKLIYKKDVDIENIYLMLCKFRRKINFALSACEGVKELEELNEKLEYRVFEAVKKIREHEEMLLFQSKSAIMGEMLEMIAHQWRQPITSIGMISNNMLFNIVISEDENLDKDLFKEELEDINKQIKYLSSTIDDFRSFFKESKTKEKVLVNDILQKSISLTKKQLEQNSIDIEVKSTCSDLVICTYKNELTQVLLNLIHNSKDAFETQEIENKQIIINSFTQDKKLIIEVKDNAGGIDKNVMTKIFQPYFSTKKDKNGTGLGLYMSKIILQKHLSSEIAVVNQDNGALFSITMPLNQDCAKEEI